MKKSQVAVAVVVALGVVWIGGAWYTGKQLETRMSEIITNANTQLNKSYPQAGLTLAYQNYQRGLFSSQMQVVLKPTAGAKNALLKADQSIVLDESIDHGPFPFAQLKKFNLLPAMASVQSKLVNNATTKSLFDATKGQSFIDGRTRIGYGGDSSTDINLLPVNYEKGTDKLAFGGGQFTTDVDSDGNNISIQGSLADTALNFIDKQVGLPVQVTLKGVKTDIKSQRDDLVGRLGTQNMSVDTVSVTVQNKEAATLEGLSVNTHAALQDDKKHLAAQINYSLDALKIQNQNIGSAKLAIKLDNLDAQAVHDFSQKYTEGSQKIMADLAADGNVPLYQQKAAELVKANLPILLKGNPVITIAPLSLKNDKGESSYNLTLSLTDPAATAGAATSAEDQFKRTVKSIDSKLVIPVAMATQLMTQVGQIQGATPEQATQFANQQVKNLADMGQMFHITTMADNSIVSSLNYADGQVTLNDKKMALSDLAGMFGGAGIQEPDSSEPPAPDNNAPVPQTDDSVSP